MSFPSPAIATADSDFTELLGAAPVSFELSIASLIADVQLECFCCCQHQQKGCNSTHLQRVLILAWLRRPGTRRNGRSNWPCLAACCFALHILLANKFCSTHSCSATSTASTNIRFRCGRIGRHRSAKSAQCLAQEAEPTWRRWQRERHEQSRR